MGLVDKMQGEARDNDSKPMASGEFVAIVKELKKINSKKTGQDYIILKTEIINVVAVKDDNQAIVGDEISKLYTPDDEKSARAFKNDMFTAGIELDYSSDEAFEGSFGLAVDKPIYWRCWVYTKAETGQKYQNQAIKSKSKITPENSKPQLAF